VAGYITTDRKIPDEPGEIPTKEDGTDLPPPPPDDDIKTEDGQEAVQEDDFVPAAVEWERPTKYIGRARLVPIDDIDTDRIFHNRYVTITDIEQMGQYTFDTLEGYEDFAEKTEPGDILITGKNFGCGSSRQQAVDCFKDLGVKVIIAGSFGAIYERNAINSGMPVITGDLLQDEFEDGDEISVDLATGEVENITKGKKIQLEPFAEVQMDIYKRGGLLE
jgi:3-isopropylmalate dehydratase small subunit